MQLEIKNAVEVKNLSVAYSAVVEQAKSKKSSVLTRSTKIRKIEALSDVSINFPAGQVTGLIGGNGAGKSTLLKTIVGVLKPSVGEVHLWGRPHLLTPGMGFNRTLSGRENVILGGLAAGMTLDEVRSKQEEIIEFADIGHFIDLPTTTYSSGMFGRLAFTVATHVDPEILLVDEALSAGDSSFRKRAVSRIRDLCSSAKAIIVVSHSSALVSDMATEAVWLHRGQVRMQGPVAEVTESYESFTGETTETAQLQSGIDRK
ncbi:MAG TPA: ABC transporter ATP-binding protein [Acidimicrobiales bacterium]|nr:ABC transporter ATP-binding protein [Acidimicrobiales bacterium]